jgi:hypothetical protein
MPRNPHTSCGQLLHLPPFPTPLARPAPLRPSPLNPQIRANLAQLKLDDATVWAREEERKARGVGVVSVTQKHAGVHM